MKTKIIIIKLSLYYIIFFILISVFYSFLYYITNDKNSPLHQYLIFSFSVSAGHTYQGLNILDDISNIIQITHKFIIGISFPIFTSFIFYYIINAQPEIKFPDKLTIRRDSNGNIVLSILIGNKEYEKNGTFLYDVECKMKYSFAVDKNKRYIRDAKTQSIKNTSVIIGFYRFSFPLIDFPNCFIESILRRDKISLMDTVMFTISGKFGHWHGNFIVSDVFKLSEIYIASGNEEIYIEKNINGKIEEIFIWHNMNKLIFYNENDELQIKNELQKYLDTKSYNHIILP
mgnify:CR=1 FL=1